MTQLIYDDTPQVENHSTNWDNDGPQSFVNIARELDQGIRIIRQQSNRAFLNDISLIPHRKT
jgi:hypothetical protein